MRNIDTTQERHPANRPPADARRAAQGVVVTRARTLGHSPGGHERLTRAMIAEKLAALKGYDYAGEYDEADDYAGAVYFVPGETLEGAYAAHALGIRTEHDLFGGVVPFGFVGTKTITHPLASERAMAPPGWSHRFARLVRGAVLSGCAAFSREDAQRGGERLLEQGAVRVKPACAIGGRGQSVVHDRQGLHAALLDVGAEEIARYGVVVEQNLAEVTTYSVGQVRVADLEATYFGTQQLTTDHGGAAVYGGSELTVVRGGFEALLALDIDAATRLAVEQARIYDAAAQTCFPGFFASRRNYDIASGRDAQGKTRCGVLEQSWRMGGASGAEIAALEAFRADPDLRVVRAKCTESYEEREPPRDATVYFRGVDAEVGFLMKYTTLEPHVDA